jgi:tRNA-2-methylthio-N6-dimethylallyladenosine synthase
VRENAENKIFGNLGYLKYYKGTKPGLTVVLCGCMVQQGHVAKEIAESHPYVDVVFGTYNRPRFPELLWLYLCSKRQIIDISEDTPLHCAESESDKNVLTSRGHTHKAGVNVMYGCDNFCSYCIVPAVRGRERSREAGDVLAEVRALAQDGVREIMLLGQNVNAYGLGLLVPETFAGLLRRVNGVPGLARIRFMTSHPKDVNDDLIKAIKDCDKVCKALHLPVQAGGSRVLRDMNRGYTKKAYLALIERLKKEIPGIAISTDIMVGYPGESEEDFGHTLDVVRQAGFAGVFSFMYSARTGTPAAKRNDTVPQEVISERFKRLTEMINPMLLQRNEGLIGKILDVMAEDGKNGRNPTQKGRADDNTLVHFLGSKARPGDIVKVRITEAKTFYVSGAREE